MHNDKPKPGDRVKFIGDLVDDYHGVPFHYTGTIKTVYEINVWVVWDKIPNKYSQTTESSLRYYEFEIIPSDNAST